MKFAETKKDIKEIGYFIDNSLFDDPIIITHNDVPKAVLLDFKAYDEMTEAIAMMRLINMSRKDIREGRCQPADEVFREIIAELDEDEKSESAVEMLKAS